MAAALTAIKFFKEQQELTSQLKEARLTKKIESLHAQCRDKLQKASDALQRVGDCARSRACNGLVNAWA